MILKKSTLVVLSLFGSIPTSSVRFDGKYLIPEDEFLDVTGTKVLRVFLLAIYSNFY
jgi:hypothetical protein